MQKFSNNKQMGAHEHAAAQDKAKGVTPQYPWSVQLDLFNYLKPSQQKMVQPILRRLKKPAQVELCVALLDYLEQGEANPPADILLGGVFLYLTTYIHPLIINH